MDLSILHWIQDTINHPGVIQVFRIITSLGNGGMIWIVFAGILLVRKRRKEAVFLLLTLGITSLSVDGVLKFLVMRERPFVIDPTLVPRITPPVSLSFPSGHSATSLCCAAFLFLCDRNLLGKCSVVISVLIALSRLVLLVHYPTDVLAGALIGVVFGTLMYILMKKYTRDSHQIGGREAK